MGGDPDAIEICSYRNVFALERRIYRIDRIRLNPGGVPIRGVLYATALVVSLLALARLPLSGWLLALLPWYVRDLALPLGAATLLGFVRLEGRAFHLAAHALARHAAGSRRLHGLRRRDSPAPGRRWRPPELVLLADGSDAHLRRVRFLGPGTAMVAVPHVCAQLATAKLGTRSRLSVRRLPTHGPLESRRVLVLARGVRLDVHRG